MSESFLDLAQLALEADVTPRTVRYYIQQGLLPAPDGRGPVARYSAGHLERLRLIRHLQREHLPLAEIRRQLEALDDTAVRRALATAGKTKPPRSAAAYVRVVLAKSGHVHASVAESAALDGASSVAAPQPHEVNVVAESRSTWERIALAPDIELHVRRPLSREQNRQLERLLDVSRQILSENA